MMRDGTNTSLITGYYCYKFVSRVCKASLGELYFTSMGLLSGCEVSRSHRGLNVICGHQLSRLALRVTQ